jgi:hypothetical protein
MWNHEPVRKIRASSGKVLGHVPSVKMERMIWFESLLERDLIYLLDYCRDITWFTEQPFEIEYIHEGKRHVYVPDILARYKEDYAVLEVKPTRFRDTKENKLRASVGDEWCAERGWEFSVVTEVDIRYEPRLSNVKKLTYYARERVSDALADVIRYILRQSSDGIELNELCRMVLPDRPQIAKVAIFHMAFWHHICLPVDEAIGPETLVSLKQ